MYLQIATQTVDSHIWQGMIFVISLLITVVLGIIAYFAKENSATQKKLVETVQDMRLEMIQLTEISKGAKTEITEIKEKVNKIEIDIHKHDNRIREIELAKS